MAFLEETQPANLYPLTWLLPNGLIFMQADWQTTLFDYRTNEETRLPNITKAQKTYPASGATAMLPLTVANNWEPTVLFCGGMNPERDDWDNLLWVVVETDTSNSCVSIKPQDANPVWVDDDDLPESRGMGSLILLPDERVFISNGAAKGSAGYGWDTWAAGQSYAQDPVLRPAIYNGSAPSGSRWSSLPPSTIPRMYHSTSTLLPDGSIFVAGSSPSADVITDANNASYPFKNEYRAEIFYPDYYNALRPTPSGIPSTISYGGPYFNLTLPRESLVHTTLDRVKVVLIRPGFSTHALNMGQRHVQLANSYTGHADGSATIHVSQLPPNPAVLVPGPALFFVVVDGVPSVASFVMVGNGVIGTQPTSPSQSLPNPIGNNLFQTGAKTPSDSNASGGVGAKEEGSGASEVLVGWMLGVVGVLAVGML